jgi:hypothetical protein
MAQESEFTSRDVQQHNGFATDPQMGQGDEECNQSVCQDPSTTPIFPLRQRGIEPMARAVTVKSGQYHFLCRNQWAVGIGGRLRSAGRYWLGHEKGSIALKVQVLNLLEVTWMMDPIILSLFVDSNCVG